MRPVNWPTVTTGSTPTRSEALAARDHHEASDARRASLPPTTHEVTLRLVTAPAVIMIGVISPPMSPTAPDVLHWTPRPS